MDTLLVLNAGSSSIKFASYGLGPATPEAADGLRMLHQGQLAQHGQDMALQVQHADMSTPERQRWAGAGSGFDAEAALERLFDWFDAHRDGLRLRAAGHRVVHGGPRHAAPERVTPALLDELDTLVPLAPLHQPHNLSPIRWLQRRHPTLPQVACFDTAFHRSQPALAQAFALPRALSESGVRRYGFHGLSYEYVAGQLHRVLGERAAGRVIVAHLGNGASLCALQGGRSIASSMGFSALDGLMMGTRCGTLDPGVLLYLLQQGLSAQRISDMLYRESGLLGVSGISGDMRVLLESPDPHAAEAIDLFVYRIVGEIGALAAALGGLDALVFTAGIGEHAAPIRQQVAQGCAWLGARPDPTANQAGKTLFHAADSRIALAVVPTDEELMIARHTLGLVGTAA